MTRRHTARQAARRLVATVPAVVVLSSCAGDARPPAASCDELLGRIEAPADLESNAPNHAPGPAGTVLFVSFNEQRDDAQNDLDFLDLFPAAAVQVECYRADGLPALSPPGAEQGSNFRPDGLPEGWSVRRLEQIEQTELQTEFGGNRVVVRTSPDDRLDAAVDLARQIDEAID